MFKFILIALFASSYLMQEIAYKPSEEFEVKIDYKFEQRPPTDPNKAEFDLTPDQIKRRSNSSPLPFLVLNITLLKINDTEKRVKIVDVKGGSTFNKKASAGDVVKVTFGFIDDVKDKISSSEYTILLLSENKQPVSRIHLVIQEDGTFLVNNEKRGKF